MQAFLVRGDNEFFKVLKLKFVLAFEFGVDLLFKVYLLLIRTMLIIIDNLIKLDVQMTYLNTLLQPQKRQKLIPKHVTHLSDVLDLLVILDLILLGER